jgi:UDP-N-acetylmuramoyl-tripeptide--D-alanyl-D-alanine ligase
MATPIPKNRARFLLAELAIATSGVLVRGAPDDEIVGVSTDTRAVEPGNLYVALRGESFDAHEFVPKAIEAGATAVLVSRRDVVEALPPHVAAILVDDVLVALGALGRAHRRRWARGRRTALVAITGSVGKTTTKTLCRAALAARFGDDGVLATEGNLNNRVGVPMTLLALEPGHAVAVVETGTSVRGEIAILAAIAEPDVAVLTTVGTAHAEGLSTRSPAAEGASALVQMSPREAVAREKMALLAAATHAAIACSDDAWALAGLLASKALRTSTFGRAEGSTYRVLSRAPSQDGKAHVVIERPRFGAPGQGAHEALELELALLGDHAAVDCAGAIAAADAASALATGTPIAEALIAAGLAKVEPPPGRFAPRAREDGALVLDDSYNASPAAFLASLEAAREIADASGRALVVVAGEMRELGPEVASGHEQVARAIVAARPRLVATCGGEAERIAAIVEGAGIAVVRRASSAEAATAVASMIAAGDVVLVKGSRGATTEKVVDAILGAILAPPSKMADSTAGNARGGA